LPISNELAIIATSKHHFTAPLTELKKNEKHQHNAIVIEQLLSVADSTKSSSELREKACDIQFDHNAQMTATEHIIQYTLNSAPMLSVAVAGLIMIVGALDIGMTAFVLVLALVSVLSITIASTVAHYFKPEPYRPLLKALVHHVSIRESLLNNNMTIKEQPVENKALLNHAFFNHCPMSKLPYLLAQGSINQRHASIMACTLNNGSKRNADRDYVLLAVQLSNQEIYIPTFRASNDTCFDSSYCTYNARGSKLIRIDSHTFWPRTNSRFKMHFDWNNYQHLKSLVVHQALSLLESTGNEFFVELNNNRLLLIAVKDGFNLALDDELTDDSDPFEQYYQSMSMCRSSCDAMFKAAELLMAIPRH